jgi:hypothetical protein
MPKSTVIADGSFDFAGGVNSQAVTTVKSALVPHGIGRDELAWASNVTVRGGGVLQRPGFLKLHDLIQSGLYQGGLMYDPIGQDSNPYLICSISGRIYKVLFDAPYTVTDLSAQFGLTNPPTVDQVYFCEGNGFLVIQAGDGVTLPLFYNSAFLAEPENLRRSNGIGKVVGTVAANFIVPAVNANVNVTLTGPYAGTVNQIVTIGGKKYIEVEPGNFFQITNVNSGAIGGLVPVGTQLLLPNGTVLASTLVDFVVPAVGANVTVKATPAYTGPLPANITIAGDQYQITAVGAANPGVNHVYLINITDTPGATVTAPISIYAVNELPAATAMIYYSGRIWYAQGRKYTAGDIEGDQASGTPGFQFGDSVLKVTENPLAVGGDGFTVPSQAGNIRAFAYTANLDTTLGQGPLYIFTRKQVYSLQVPVTRADWIAADNTKQPVQTVSQVNNGAVGERCIVHVNGDLFYQSFDPAVRSLIVATRFYQQWGNLQISNNVNRALAANDRSILRFASGIEFDNRLLECCLPKQTPSGVVCQGILSLDFDLVSTLQEQAPPAWEGPWSGLDILQLFTGDFGGLPRAFAVVVSRKDQSIDVWELSKTERFDNDNLPSQASTNTRVQWFAEFPSFTWGHEFDMKELQSGELWVDRAFGTVEIKVEYRVDADPCWRFWFETSLCAAKDCAEADLTNCYPSAPNFREGYKWPIVFPAPKPSCDSMGVRPTTQGYQFQVRITVLGWMRVRGIILYASEKDRELYKGLSC